MRIELQPVTRSVAPKILELMDACRTDPSIQADFQETLDVYTNLEDTANRLGQLYDSATPTRHGYVAVGDETPVGIGWLGLDAQEVTRYDQVSESFTGINISFFVRKEFRRRGVARRLAHQLRDDVGVLKTQHGDWQNGLLWTGVRPENHASRSLVTSLGMISVGTRTADPTYLVYF